MEASRVSNVRRLKNIIIEYLKTNNNLSRRYVVLQCLKMLGLSYAQFNGSVHSTADTVIKILCDKGVIKRIAHGKYIKL